ncbi:replication restart helicase PriA [Pedobacter metabolipauper]|uniref:Replication restart protein PriA n=1 Tax=Pedobacter metabolipauper TaxID=425513 RepID=A0A4R6SPJ3_9SPHI|nr:primosomal protein N' [Pedobacter metabolipauper]TDQ06453.1 replication restart DNA helicase PriA [Pedobacter metabolipauper]
MLDFKDPEFIERETLFIEVILPLSLSINYFYRVPFDLNDQVAVGKRVVVQFGKNKIYTALIKRISTNAPGIYEAKYIIDVVDTYPIVTEAQLQLWDWMTAYYMCNEGEVMAAALPTGLKLASETIIVLKEDAAYNEMRFTDKEQIIIAAFKNRPRLTIDDVSALLGQKTVYPIINSLLDKGLIYIAEEVIEKYKPLLKSFLSLQPFYKDEANLKPLFTVLERAPKQMDAFLAFLKLSRQQEVISKQQLLEESNCGAAALKALIDKEIFKVYKKPVSRLNENSDDLIANFELSPAQLAALTQIENGFDVKDVVLLHGITASGKTQIYIKLIERAIEKGGQVLFLLPEIALTTQIVERIQRYFGDAIGVYHSKFNNNERVEIWNKVLNGTYRVVLGARSAVFLPFKELKLIVVDEEHESSYKQHDPAPRYQARDTAVYLAHLHTAKIVLGSATPSVESYFNAKAGKYELVTLNERYGGVELPLQEVISIAEETKKKKMVSYFTSKLIDEITLTLENKEQVILFQNRRGYATILICATCGYAPKCVNCDVSLTYHKTSGKLHCHYCGYHQSSINICPACGSVHIEQKGFGTERVEEELSLIFPEARIARLDVDSTRTKNGLQQIISEFQNKKTDILIGTQMVAKGLDFDNVTLIGVINADTLLNYPDFRAFERSYQLLAQVAGRAGRRDKQGKVIIQAYADDHRIITQVIDNKYQEMYAEELAERKQFNYPPFTRLIFINIRHKDHDVLNVASQQFATALRMQLGKRVLGPEQPLVSRIRNYYIKQVIIKSDKDTSIQKVKSVLREIILQFQSEKEFRGANIQVDVDPY